MKQQNSIFTSTLQCILAGFCSGFFFNIIMIFIIMLLSDRLNADTLEENLKDDLVSGQIAEVRPEKIKQGTLLFKANKNLTHGYTLAPTLDTDVHIQITGGTSAVVLTRGSDCFPCEAPNVFAKGLFGERCEADPFFR